MGEVKMTRCPPIYGRNLEAKRKKDGKQAVKRCEHSNLQEEKAINWAAEKKEAWGRDRDGPQEYSRDGANKISQVA